MKSAALPNTGTDVFYLHADHLGTPRKISRPSDNQVLWTWESEAFGNSPPNQNPSGQGDFVFNLRFPGQYFDAETGLNYNYFRDYDPSTGRYIQSDPIGLEGGINTYGYANGNPLNAVDLLGLAPNDEAHPYLNMDSKKGGGQDLQSHCRFVILQDLTLALWPQYCSVLVAGKRISVYMEPNSRRRSNY